MQPLRNQHIFAVFGQILKIKDQHLNKFRSAPQNRSLLNHLVVATSSLMLIQRINWKIQSQQLKKQNLMSSLLVYVESWKISWFHSMYI